MPSGLIDDEDGVRPWRYLDRDLIEMPLHGLGVAARQDEGRADAPGGTDGAEYPGRLRALINARSGPTSPWRPAPGGFGFLTDPSFVLPPDFYPGADREPVAELRHFGGKFF